MNERAANKVRTLKPLPGLSEELQMPAQYILMKKDEVDRETSYMQEDRERAVNRPEEARAYAEELAEAFDSSPEERDITVDEFTDIEWIDEKIARHEKLSASIGNIVEDMKRGKFQDAHEFFCGQLMAEEAVPKSEGVTPEYRERKAAEIPALRRYIALLESKLNWK